MWVVGPVIAITYTITACVFAISHSSESMGWKRTLLLLGLTIFVSLFFETVGVSTGVFYGGYHYSDNLGPMFLNLVPVLIPLAWYMMLYPSLVIAMRVVPHNHNRWVWVLTTAGVGALVMTCWDLVIDPLMVSFGYWDWEVGGVYFGVPIHNYLGWMLTAFITLCLFLFVGRIPVKEFNEWEDAYDRLPVIIYAITGLSSVLVALNRGLIGPGVVGILTIVPCILAGWWGNKITPALRQITS